MSERIATVPSSRIGEAFTNAQRVYLAVASGGAILLFLILSRVMGWPTYLRLEASLLAGAAPMAGVAAVVLGMMAAVILGSLLLGRLRYEAGLFVACIGLGAIAARGGTVGSTLRSVGRPQIYTTMLMETIMLLGVMGLAWQTLTLLSRQGWLPPEPSPGENELRGTPLQKIMATFVQAILTGLLVALLARVDNKKQVMASVLIASWFGSIGAHQAFPVRPSATFWVGPFLTGIAGYAWAIGSPGAWPIGIPANGLVMVSPLDYASLGTVGAIFGYWVSRQWREGPPEIELPEEI